MKMVNITRVLAFFIGFFSFISTVNSQEPCGTDELITQNSFLQQRSSCPPEIDLDTAQVLTIPIVFHILHLGEPIGEGTNISDEQILSCVENLNHRYRGDVEALALLTNEYDENELSLAIDSKIEFCLAARDPQGLPTTGIIRHDCSDVPEYVTGGINNNPTNNEGSPESYLKNLFRWPLNQYLNCYVVSEINGNDAEGGTQGYSYVGFTGGSLYGPVCLYNVTGTVGELKSNRTLNTTWTHEIGHALGLFHTFFNPPFTACIAESTCTNGDYIPDTPSTYPNYSCNVATCSDAIKENYMDYTSEVCKTSFTQNQIERMREEILENLSSLVNNTFVCQPINDFDLGISNVTLPNSWCLPTINFSVKIFNYGEVDVEEAILIFNGVSYTVSNIEAFGFETVYFNEHPLGDGQFNFELIYSEDQYLDNNTFTKNIEFSEENWIELALRPDYAGFSLDWKLTNEFGNILLQGGDYEPNIDTTIYKTVCVPDGCYTFTITDYAGDGMCSLDLGDDGICDFYQGAFIDIKVNGVPEFNLSQPDEIDFGSELVVDFCTEYTCPLDSDPCPWDLNDDGDIDLQDLLDMLLLVGQSVPPCTPGDFNGNENIGSDDLLEFLAYYGLSCSEIEAQDNTTFVAEPIEFASPVETLYFDIVGRPVNSKGRLTPGIYIIVKKWSNGNITTEKIFVDSGNALIER